MQAGNPEIHIDLRRQRLRLLREGRTLHDFAVSSGANGIGEIQGSGMTPRGLHVVRARIGAGAPGGSVFRGRRATGEVWSPELHAAYPQRDWILTRILWLSGLERGRNRLGCVDTFRRYIYLHGAPSVCALGTPGSHGCVRMANDDIIALFDQVTVGTCVLLHE
ncbi:MAG: L,D-transpeptidase [Hydrocarboniphaga sp.]|uniref:L,D-transpeptidase n=1 Tax=Hydrocarboniphaga sp. TaxID=2033016 RepID=UPI002603A168|nr:L,D-transpeptidase [Hydrocarboniphaga sp.]MDB5967904.1 L,D-transpeptidase [Hydrocarboniphaga sp.]